MKRIIFCVALIAMLAGCDYQTVQTTYTSEEQKQSTPSMFVEVEDTEYWKVVFHRDTKVMWVVSNFGQSRGEFTLLVNADGTPMLWEG